MLKRILDAWPYALALVVGFVVVAVAANALLRSDPSAVMGVTILYAYILSPLALLVGGIVLGVRRGFDWVTLLVCLVVFVLAFAVLGLTVPDPAFLQSYLGPAVWALFLPPVLIGTGIGTGVRALVRSTRAAGQA